MRRLHAFYVLIVVVVLLAGCGGGTFVPPPAGGTVTLNPTSPVSLHRGQSVVVVATTSGSLKGTDIMWRTTSGPATAVIVSASAVESSWLISLPTSAQGDSTITLKTVFGAVITTITVTNLGP